MNERAQSWIKLEVANILQQADIDSLLELYENVACFDTEVEKGVKEEWISNIELFYSFAEGTMRIAHKNLINTESFVKKILFLLDDSAYTEAHEGKNRGYFKALEHLGIVALFPPNTNFSNAKSDDFADPIKSAIITTYQLKNNASHTSEAWAMSDMSNNVKAILITTFFIIWKHRQRLGTIVQREANSRKYNVEMLMKDIVSSYQKKQRNGFKYVQLKWVIEGKKGDSNQEHLIDVKELLPNGQLMLLGEAGSGKTTALEWLEYYDADSYVKNDSKKIPVKIQLINEISSMTIIELICKKLSIPTSYAEKLLKNNDIHLYIDGINELPGGVDARKEFVKELDSFITNYPNLFVVVTDRSYNLFKPSISTSYSLKKLGKNEIIIYAKSRPEYTKDIEKRLDEVFSNKSYAEFNYTPLLVNYLIDVLASDKNLPEDPTGFIGLYIESLLKREYEDKMEVIAGPGKLDLLLMRLSLVDGINTDGLSISKVLKSFAETINEYGLGNIKSDDCYELAKQLNILSENNNRIKFASSEIYSYFLTRAYDEDIE